MSETVLVAGGLYFDKYDLSCGTTAVALSARSEVAEATALCDRTHRFIGTLKTVGLGASGNWRDEFSPIHDYVADNTVRPITALLKLTDTPGAYCTIGAGHTVRFDQFDSSIGELLKFQLGLEIKDGGGIARAKILANTTVNGIYDGGLQSMELSATSNVLVNVHFISVTSNISWAITDGTTTQMSGTATEASAVTQILSLAAGKSLKFTTSSGAGKVVAAAGKIL